MDGDEKFALVLPRLYNYGYVSDCKKTVRSREENMPDSVYKVIELIGSSADSWEKAASNAILTASKTINDIRIAEVVEMDLIVEDGKVSAYRTKLNVSFKIHGQE